MEVDPIGIVKVEVLDTAGQEEYKELRDTYMRESEGFLLVYSLTESGSLRLELEEFYQQILMVKQREDGVPMVLVGNKFDLESEREVGEEEGQHQADEWNVAFFETSAKTGLNVRDAFFALVRAIHRDRKSRGDDGVVEDIHLDPIRERHSFHRFVLNFGHGIQDCCLIM